MGEQVEKLKQRWPLLDYLQQQNWVAQPTGYDSEFVLLCPLHEETRPSFYVNARKNLFYCHGCGQGGDLIRSVVEWAATLEAGLESSPAVRFWEIWLFRRLLPRHALHGNPHEREVGKQETEPGFPNLRGAVIRSSQRRQGLTEHRLSAHLPQ
jgi:hypothetical protein